ncbi:MAG: class I SAM-dependent methyltransferase [Candidatus Micrarchaeota archaeon]
MYNEYSGVLGAARRLYFRKVAGYFKKGAKVLDVGSGQGDFLSECKKAEISAEGIDFDKKWIGYCKKKGLKVSPGNAESLSFKDNSFDVVFCQSVIEHLDDPQKAISEFRRTLKPGGLAIVSAPTPGPYFWDDPTHKRPYTPKALKTLLETSGFKRVRCTYVLFFLLGLWYDGSFVYRLLNMFQFSLGSNLICIGSKGAESE